MASMAAAAASVSIPSSARSPPCEARQWLPFLGPNRFHSLATEEHFHPSNCKQLHHARVSCAAKPETVEKVCAIVRKQLALSDDTPLNSESKFSQLGADSLDTVEIVMGFEEEFGISVEEESAQNIQTVQDAADMIDKLVAKKSG